MPMTINRHLMDEVYDPWPNKKTAAKKDALASLASSERLSVSRRRQPDPRIAALNLRLACVRSRLARAKLSMALVVERDRQYLLAAAKRFGVTDLAERLQTEKNHDVVIDLLERHKHLIGRIV